MIDIFLLSDLDIVNKIFKLVSKKLSLNLTIIQNDNQLEKCDIIIIDDKIKDTNILKYKSLCNSLVYITNEDNQLNNDYNHILKKPFLPSTLEIFLEKLINLNKINDTQEEDSVDESMEDLVSFVSSIDNENLDEQDDEYIVSEDDETVIHKEDLGQGGVLDKNELTQLFDMINDEEQSNKEITSKMKDEDWIDLSKLIDDAIDDVQEYEFKENEPIKLILNQFSMQELMPLLKKLDQHIIDSLTDGKDITLMLRLEKNNEK